MWRDEESASFPDGAVSPKHKPVTCPRAMQQKKDVHARAQAQLPNLPGNVHIYAYSTTTLRPVWSGKKIGEIARHRTPHISPIWLKHHAE
jgi:hypothetical protein